MNQIRRKVHARLVVTLVIVTAFLVGSLDPAAAGPTTVNAVTGSGLGYWADNISLFGGSQGDMGPAPTVRLAPDASNSPQNATSACGFVGYGPAVLFTSDTLNVSTSGSRGTTGSATSSSSISNINKATNTACPVGTSTYDLTAMTGSEIFTADGLNGTATASAVGASGASTVTNGTLAIHSNSANNCTHVLLPCGGHSHDLLNPDGLVNIPANPPPNYRVAGHVHLDDTWTDYFVVAFNEQIINSDGSITVNPVHEYFGAKLDENGNIVRDPPYIEGGSILHGDLYIGQVVAGVARHPTRKTSR